MSLKKLAGIILLVLLLFAAIWFYKTYRTLPTFPAYENPLINDNGQTVNVSDLKDRYVLISYFQTWCGDCIKELPSIDKLQNEVGNKKLIVLMVSDEKKDKIDRFKEKYCNTLNYYQSLKSLHDMNIRVFPTTYLLDKKGAVIMGKLEGYDWSNEQVIQLIK